jgi:hypothetical protein
VVLKAKLLLVFKFRTHKVLGEDRWEQVRHLPQVNQVFQLTQVKDKDEP